MTGWRFTAQYAASAVAYTFYLYYNFSGYMDIVIGIGWLLGQNLPENFNRPFAARNIFEFWSRWHITTLSEWFKTYLFNPLMKFLAGHVAAPVWLPYLGVIAFFVTFFVMGVWHGSTGVFVIYGLVMGAGASINKLFQVFMAQQLGKKQYKAVSESFAYATLARGLMFAFFRSRGYGPLGQYGPALVVGTATGGRWDANCTPGHCPGCGCCRPSGGPGRGHAGAVCAPV